MNHKTNPAERLTGKVKAGIQRKVNQLNDSVNKMDREHAKWSFILAGATIACLCAAITIRGLLSSEASWLEPSRITLPKYMHMDTLRSERLTPLGKMKGEIEGEFEAFYLAIDKEGNLFINRNLEYSGNAYDKSNGWQQISAKQFEFYEKRMHLIPPGNRRLRK